MTIHYSVVILFFLHNYIKNGWANSIQMESVPKNQFQHLGYFRKCQSVLTAWKLLKEYFSMSNLTIQIILPMQRLSTISLSDEQLMVCLPVI